jgi:hypothetical protein
MDADGTAMHREISVNWWRRWAGWSAAWVLGWLLLLLIISDGPTFSPGETLSKILALVFGMPVLALAARWSVPRALHWGAHAFKSEHGGWRDDAPTSDDKPPHS